MPGTSPGDTPAPATRLRRLTHYEWSSTVADLLGLDVSELTAAFRSDPRTSGALFDNNAVALEVDQALAAAYQRVAAQLAEQVTADDTKLAQLVPGGNGSDEARAHAFVESFGRRAYRKPLTTQQVERYMRLFQTGLEAFNDAPGFAGGIRLLIEAFLQSAHFLYRIELSDAVEGGLVPLDGWERATRLSYFLWGSMPDEELLLAAESGALDDARGVEAQARRMLEDERTASAIERFYGQVFEVSRYARIAPAPSFFPNASEHLGAFAAEETKRFVRHTMYEQAGTVSDLLTSTTTFVNDELAALYGLQGTFGREFEQVQLDPAERKGILTQIGFLASHATSVNPDPIHRGLFVAMRLSCMTVAAPPDELPPLPQPGDKTNREIVEEHTEAEGSTCRVCHGTVINPFGFPFESYDAVGAYRTEDNGKPVDTTAAPPVDGQPTPVRDATELAELMANSETVHECMAKHLVEFAHGRLSSRADNVIVAALGRESLAGAAFKEVMMRLSLADSFLNRSPEETP